MVLCYPHHQHLHHSHNSLAFSSKPYSAFSLLSHCLGVNCFGAHCADSTLETPGLSWSFCPSTASSMVPYLDLPLDGGFDSVLLASCPGLFIHALELHWTCFFFFNLLSSGRKSRGPWAYPDRSDVKFPRTQIPKSWATVLCMSHLCYWHWLQLRCTAWLWPIVHLFQKWCIRGTMDLKKTPVSYGRNSMWSH